MCVAIFIIATIHSLVLRRYAFKLRWFINYEQKSTEDCVDRLNLMW